MSMMDSMAGMSVEHSMASVQYQASLSVAKKAMDTTEQLAVQELQMLPPTTGVFDAYA